MFHVSDFFQIDNATNEQYSLPVLSCSSIIVVVHGQAKLDNNCQIKRGDIFYIPPREELRFTVIGNLQFTAYRTFSYESGNSVMTRQPCEAWKERRENERITFVSFLVSQMWRISFVRIFYTLTIVFARERENHSWTQWLRSMLQFSLSIGHSLFWF